MVAVSVTACSPKTADSPQAASATAGEVTLTTEQRRSIHLYTVAQSSYHRTFDTTGTVDFDNDQATSVLAPFSGPVSRLLVAAGDRVRKGTPLALVESPDFAATISSYRKALATARNARRLANLETDLAQHQGVAQREQQQAQTDAANAEADRDAALQALVALGVDGETIKNIQDGRPITRTLGVIRAPIEGTVVEKLISPGQIIQAGSTPCFTVADLSRVWVMAQIFGSDVTAVHTGDTAEVITNMGAQPFTGKVTNIASLVDPNTRSVQARVVVANPGALLKKLMYVRVLIHSRQESTGLLIPASAILRDDENLPFVYVLQHDGSFARRAVTLGYRAGDQYDIAEGLAAGEQVVVEGGIFVQFMQSQ